VGASGRSDKRNDLKAVVIETLTIRHIRNNKTQSKAILLLTRNKRKRLYENTIVCVIHLTLRLLVEIGRRKKHCQISFALK
jgi:hypothetical protein